MTKQKTKKRNKNKFLTSPKIATILILLTNKSTLSTRQTYNNVILVIYFHLNFLAMFDPFIPRSHTQQAINYI